jgi:penicillin-binding protein 1A
MTDTDFDFDFDVDRDAATSGTRADDDAGAGNANGKANGSNGSRANGPSGSNGSRGSDKPPLVHDDDHEPGFDAPADDPAPFRRFRRTTGAEPGHEAPPAADREDDWLSMDDDGLGDDGLDSIAAPDDGPAGPPTPGEGRKLARSARRRATGREPEEASSNGASGDSADDGDFEALLERQPYGLRGLLDDGRERLRGGRHKLGELKDRVPDSLPMPGSAGAGRGSNGNGNGSRPPRGAPTLPKRIGSRRPRKAKPGRVKKLRLVVILVGLAALGMVSTVFGMMMAVSGDLPDLESKEQYAQAQNSEVFDSQGRKMGTLLSNTGRILVESEDINPYMKQAVVAIEDQRFYEHQGVDFRGIGRAVFQDLVPGGSVQGASTITQQFVKNALEAQNSRTVFQKLRESALAYHLERQWDKDKILTQYLNTIYFGEGAYGIEAAARTYFGQNHPECMVEGADPCASELLPHEAAMLAGIITSPSAFSPRANPQDALARRNLVLQKMVEQGDIDEAQYVDAAEISLPAPSDIERPAPDSLSPYFTEWLRQQLVDKYGAGRAFGGGLDVRTTLDLDMQEAAESAAFNTLAGIEPTASVVVIDNDTGGVKAMVGGNDFVEEPFNLATNGHRQPGSSFKPFTLITAFENGFGPGSYFPSAPQEFPVPNSGGSEVFKVSNYDDTYYGGSDLATATIHSDNSIFAQLGFGENGLGRKGPQKVGETAVRMGIDPESFDTNPAMILGGIDPGVTPLEMAYAYSTIARGGVRIGGELDSSPGPNNTLEDLAPVAIREVVKPDGSTLDGGKEEGLKEIRAIPQNVADTTKDILRQNVLSGTGENAQTGGFAWGKTGTTDNNGDAWFCGGSDNFTACVWVGHAQTNTPMETEFSGAPVDGGTFPALIWSQIIQACEAIREAELASQESADDEGSDSSSSDSSSSAPYIPPSSGGSSSGGSGGGSGQSTPAPAPATPAPAPSGGGGGAPSGTGGTGL